ncbi:MAG: DUF354 domain-containing protein [Marinobacter sp.]|uniref:DUF354 domain-containing protein n=1 Tax=Marinobacter sp. TaxID=50741 RepID=UPI00299F0F76|nr:DUF354 domain-containing protein [Marinobacter sp.]MDX1756687.1 DUF354 domain-containing protein [Marinobacter sp.]
MKVLIDICHPAHFHFFKKPIDILESLGHEVVITSRDKEVAIKLIEESGREHQCLYHNVGEGIWGLATELLGRNFALYRYIRKEKPDVMAAIGGIFVAQVGAFTRIPSIAFYDTENAKLQNLFTYPFASVVSVPDCYQGRVPPHTDRYKGYHELSYLHPDSFEASREIAVDSGLSPTGDTFLIRVVSWKANHDIGEEGWSQELLEKVVIFLSQRGKVIVSSEGPLPEKLERFAYLGNPSNLHHVMAFCRLFVGESATMASESVVLGVPAIYAANTGRGYCDEQEHKYGLLRNLRTLDFKELETLIRELLLIDDNEVKRRWQSMLDNMIDVPNHVVNLILQAGENISELRRELNHARR